MDIESFLPINTKEKIDEIISLIISNQESKSIYTDIIIHIQKVKMQLYFKERFDNIKGRLPLIQVPNNNVPLTRNTKSKDCTKKGTNKINKGVIVVKDKIVGIHLFCGMTLKQLSDFIDIPMGAYSPGMKSRLQFAMNTVEPASILLLDEWTELILTPCLDFLQNAYNIRLRKDKKQALLDKEIETAGYCRKKMEDKFKPSLGQEGNYRKLIYIRTKT